MSINEPMINSEAINDVSVSSIDEALFSPAGLFLWGGSLDCRIVDLFVSYKATFNSVRDDLNNNRDLVARLRCITGVQVSHICVQGSV